MISKMLPILLCIAMVQAAHHHHHHHHHNHGDDHSYHRPKGKVSLRAVESDSECRDTSRWDSRHSVYKNVAWCSLHSLRPLHLSKVFSLFSATWNNKPVVIKMAPTAARGMLMPKASTELRHESSLLRHLRHPNIIKVLGEGNEPDTFMLTERCTGGLLTQRMKDYAAAEKGDKTQSYHSSSSSSHYHRVLHSISNQRLTWAVRIAHGIAHGMEYLHEHSDAARRLIHRDLKPDNIGFTAAGVLKIFDFGLSTLVAKKPGGELFQLASTGTWEYSAPEVLNLDHGKYTARYNHKADVFSFAVIFYELVTGIHPGQVAGGVNETVYTNRLIEHLWRPNTTGLPEPVIEILEEAWHNDVQKRSNFTEIKRKLYALSNTYNAYQMIHL